MKKLLCAVLLMVVAVGAAGCASKAKAIQAGTTNFSVESHRAITLLDGLMTREATETLSGPDKISELFAKQALNSTGMITTEQMEGWADPYAYPMPELKKHKNAYLTSLLTTYAEFGLLFRSLDKGSLIATKDVTQAIPLTKHLTANMAALGKHWADHPANFIQDKGTLAKDLNIIVMSPTLTPETKSLMIKEIRRQLREIQKQERQMTQALVTQALKSATLGQSLTTMLEQYDKLTVDDINEALSKSFLLAGVIPGLELGKYQAKATEIMTELEKDQESKALLDQAFGTLSSGQ